MTTTPQRPSNRKSAPGENPFDAVFAPKAKLGGARPTSEIPEPNGKLVGYARVSTEMQILDRQLDALRALGCDPIYTDKETGTRLDRTQLKEMCYSLEEGDTVVVTHLSRLGRSAVGVIRLVSAFTEIGVGFRSLNEGIDTRTAGGKLILNLFATLAEIERDGIVEATRAGLKSASERGRKGGRPRSINKPQALRLHELLRNESKTITEAASMMGLHRHTVAKWDREEREASIAGRSAEFWQDNYKCGEPSSRKED